MQETKDASSIPGLGRSPEGGHGNLLQYSCLENPKDRGAWWTTVHGVAKNLMWLKSLGTHMHNMELGWDGVRNTGRMPHLGEIGWPLTRIWGEREPYGFLAAPAWSVVSIMLSWELRVRKWVMVQTPQTFIVLTEFQQILKNIFSFILFILCS